MTVNHCRLLKINSNISEQKGGSFIAPLDLPLDPPLQTCLISRKVRGQFKVPLVTKVLIDQHTVSSRSCPLLASSSIRQSIIDCFDRSYVFSVGAILCSSS